VVAERDPTTGRFVGSGKGTSFESLGQRLDEIGKRGVRNVEKAMRGAAIIADQVLVFGTPVDVGIARGGWVVSHGSPNLTPQETPDKEGNTTLARNEREIFAFKVGRDMFISNAVFYIVFLDQGTSRQAPRLFSQEAAREAIAYLKRQKYLAR